ncbi:amidophosphoribosyltransferase [Candidatus Woesearchaeota archaeon]|nr:amidophosphoribosyltransferase [Candidatus Woesearchaeota archaeon]
MADVKEECGIVAVASLDNKHETVIPILYRLLLNVQSRGQLSAGMTSFNKDRDFILRTYRNLGSVNEVFRTSRPPKCRAILKKHAGPRAIGHVRYATCGADDRTYAQPFERRHGKKWKWFSYAFNGNIANYKVLKDDLLKKKDYHLTRDTDTEVLMHMIARKLNTEEKPDYVKIFRELADDLDGAYSSVMMNAFGDIILARDPHGFKPLCYGYLDGIFVAASESNALLNLGIHDIRDVKPGHIVIVNGNKVSEKCFAKSEKTSHCMFEYVYFANVCSTLDKKSVYMARTRMGQILAQTESLKVNDDFIVVPVPDSSKPAGDAMAFELGLPSMEGIVRNRFVGRTFIEGSDRFEKIRNKFTVLRKVVNGKKIILVDDSIVRGNTSKSIVRYLKEVGGAKEVHMRIACPPIVAPCFYGIDMSTISELFAPSAINDPLDDAHIKEKCKQLAAELGADSLRYLTISNLIKAIGMPRENLCLGCLTRVYPTPYGNQLYKVAKTNRDNGSCGRTY